MPKNQILICQKAAFMAKAPKQNFLEIYHDGPETLRANSLRS